MATVRTPSSWPARNTRMAISLRLATSSLVILGIPVAGQRLQSQKTQRGGRGEVVRVYSRAAALTGVARSRRSLRRWPRRWRSLALLPLVQHDLGFRRFDVRDLVAVH